MAGDIDEAQEIYREALRLAVGVKAVPIALDAILGMAQIYEEVGKPEHAVELSCCVRNHTCSIQEVRERTERLLVKLNTKSNCQQGNNGGINPQIKTFDQIVDEVLKTN